MSIGSQLADLPITGLIVSLAKGIAQAQLELDETSMEIARMMSGVEDEDRVVVGGVSYSLLELGLTPTFYHFSETTLEIKVSVSMTIHGKGAPGGRYAHMVSAVDAGFASKFQYSVEGSSSVRTKLVPVPPPPVFQEHIQILMAEEQKYRDALASP